MAEKIRQTIWCCVVGASMVWVFGYIDGWGWILQIGAISFAAVAIWEIWTDQISDPWAEDEE